ncbi:carbohydrate-binding protein [Xanthomonas sp. SS]|uniref:Ig-like domain-containing protein n=1 Tax=Xanthomonas sp. SS TaxID=2724122 RepID=UPI001861DA08|nr:Ig-like domain-containing protein [Xanthomonas sp. SS]QNH17421.1 carbohydrate-binding protein [Xanthomonas sp. SS]
MRLRVSGVAAAWRRPRAAAALLAVLLGAACGTVTASAVAAADGEALQASNASLGYPHFKGTPTPIPDSGVAFAPGGHLQRVFAADLAAGAGTAPGKDFWIDRMLARSGTGGGFDDDNNWLFSRGRAAYMYTHQPQQPGFVGDVAYAHKTGHDALFRLQAEIDGKPLHLVEESAQRRQTPSYFSSVYADADAGVRLRLVKFISEQNVAVAEATLSSSDGVARTLTLRAISPMAAHADGAELTGAFATHNAITTVFPRLSGDGFAVEGGSIARRVALPASGEAATLKVQLGLVTRELPASLSEYRRIAAQSPQQAYREHVVAYNRWWADNLPYLDTPEDNIDKTLFYRWWLLRFNFLDAAVPGNDYQFPVAIEGVLGYDNAIVLTTGMFIDDLKYLRDPSYAYGSWLGAGETAGGGKYVDNPGAPENWSNSYAQYLSAAAWRAYQLHGGPPAVAAQLARYASADVDALLRAYDRNNNGLIEYDWAAMTGNDADAVSFDWAKQHGQIRMDRSESAYVYANALAAAQAAQLAGDAATAVRMQALAAKIRSAVLAVLWQDHSATADGMGLHGDLLKQRQADGARLPVDWKETNNYYPFSVGLMPKQGDADYDPKYVRALRLFADTRQYPIFPFYTANQADRQARGAGGSNNFSVINSTVAFRLLGSALRDYPSPYLDAGSYRKLLYWNAWAHYIDGDNRYPDQNEFWAQGSAADGGSIGYRSWIHHTQLGATNFTVIEDAMGLRPRSDAQIELYPIDIGWDHFAADAVRYRDRDLSIVWDRDGRHYGGALPKGYSLYLDGKLAFTVDRLAHVLYDPASGRVQALPDALNADAAQLRVLGSKAIAVQTPAQVRFAADARITAVLADAGVDTTLPATAHNLAQGAAVSASYAADGFPASAVVDGSTANEPFWGTAGSPSRSDWIELDLGRPQLLDDVRLYFYRSSSPPGEQHGFASGTRAGYAPPWLYVLQYFDGHAWKTVPGQVRDAPIAQGNRNRVRFPALRVQRLRVLVTHAGALRTGIKEIQAYASGARVPAAKPNQAPQVEAWQQDGVGGGALRVVGRVGDDALPNGSLALHWSVLQAPPGGAAIFEEPQAASSSVRFTAPGAYTLRLQADDGALQGHADVAVVAAPTPAGQGLEVQGEAEASAQVTAGHHRLQALNDGLLPAPDQVPSADRRWGSWGRAQPASVWVQYQWRQPQRLNAAALYFWDDQPDGGVAPPRAWKLQYRDGEQWRDIAVRGGYPVAARGEASRVAFAAVTTSALRAVLDTAVQGDGHAAVGIDEWQVFAERAAAVEPIDVRVAPGEMPVLPQRIAAYFADGSWDWLGVRWPQLDASSLAGEGRVQVQGLADGGLPVSASIWVRATAPGQINTVQAPPPLHVHAGQVPALPAFVGVQYNDGSRERVPVQWPPLAPTAYAAPGTSSIVGSAQGRGGSGQLPVRLQIVVDAAVAP